MTLKMRAVEPTLPPPIYSPELAIPEECKHPHFWFHDGDVVFSAESIHFKIHSHKVFPLSAIMFQVFEQSPKPVHPRGFYSLTELEGGYLGWSCLLGVIYNKEYVPGILRSSTIPQARILILIVKRRSIQPYKNSF